MYAHRTSEKGERFPNVISKDLWHLSSFAFESLFITGNGSKVQNDFQHTVEPLAREKLRRKCRTINHRWICDINHWNICNASVREPKKAWTSSCLFEDTNADTLVYEERGCRAWIHQKKILSLCLILTKDTQNFRVDHYLLHIFPISLNQEWRKFPPCIIQIWKGAFFRITFLPSGRIEVRMSLCFQSSTTNFNDIELRCPWQMPCRNCKVHLDRFIR